jgi:hypothetical protein
MNERNVGILEHLIRDICPEIEVHERRRRAQSLADRGVLVAEVVTDQQAAHLLRRAAVKLDATAQATDHGVWVRMTLTQIARGSPTD